MTAAASITVVGLGYVGLPLALAFAKQVPTVGFDVDASRVEELSNGVDRNREVPETEITASTVSLTTDPSCVADAEFIVVTVPTPVTDDHKPDLSLLESASASIGSQLRNRSEGLPGPIIVYESTTYPGCTEDFCGPIIERESGLISGEGFFLGYSPERTNFGDAEHSLETVIKVVSGQTPGVAEHVSDTYGLIAKAGTHLAADIRTAEASKVIENVQRDLNIALFNELAMIFDRMNINSSDVFDAAATKWNFHRYQPGLVGGHCIPVDPYYLTHAAAEAGYDADVVLAGRAVNESMPEFVAEKVLAHLREIELEPEDASVLVLGQTFKSDVADVRNSKAITLAENVASFGVTTRVYDPLVNIKTGPRSSVEVLTELTPELSPNDVLVLATPHQQFLESAESMIANLREGGLMIDVTGSLDPEVIKELGKSYWSP